MSQEQSYKVYRKIKQWHIGMSYESDYSNFNYLVKLEKKRQI